MGLDAAVAAGLGSVAPWVATAREVGWRARVVRMEAPAADLVEVLAVALVKAVVV